MNNKIKAAEQLEICEKFSEKNLEEEFIIYRHKNNMNLIVILIFIMKMKKLKILFYLKINLKHLKL